MTTFDWPLIREVILLAAVILATFAVSTIIRTASGKRVCRAAAARLADDIVAQCRSPESGQQRYLCLIDTDISSGACELWIVADVTARHRFAQIEYHERLNAAWCYYAEEIAIQLKWRGWLVGGIRRQDRYPKRPLDVIVITLRSGLPFK